MSGLLIGGLALRQHHLRLQLQQQQRRGIIILRSLKEMTDYQGACLPSWRAQSDPVSKRRGVGFVPTMGALHSGHVSLVAEARKHHACVVASIFVNPTQFGIGEDLDKYPRTFDKDVEMLKEAGVSCVFAPTVSEMYHPKHPPLCHVEPRAFSSISEGVARPDFFRGVATVVTKLFNIVQPTAAYFGQKDVAQCVLVKNLVRDLNMPVVINVCETMRESDGLAMSSRNTYLKPNERAVAGVLHRALTGAQNLVLERTSSVTRAEIIATAETILRKEPLVHKIEYISIASPDDMTELDSVSLEEGGAVISAAIRLGSVRLIDNVVVVEGSNLPKK